MHDHRRITWLASYPKSGNTWTRCFLRAYQFDAYEPININQIGRISQTDCRRSYYEELVDDPEHAFTDEEINALRRQVQQRVAREIGEHQVAKTHNARVRVDSTPLIYDEFTKRAVYVVRNPLDVVDSLADHTNATHDQAIEAMNDRTYSFGGADKKFVRQYLDTWSNHVRSWTVGVPFPVMTLRYEDLLADPIRYFSELLQFLGWMFDSERVSRAVHFSNFDVLRATEQSEGFKEVSEVAKSQKFFRRGQAGSWKTLLSDEQQARVAEHHHEVMRQYGYL